MFTTGKKLKCSGSKFYHILLDVTAAALGPSAFSCKSVFVLDYLIKDIGILSLSVPMLETQDFMSLPS